MDDNKSSKTQGAVTLGRVLLCLLKDLKKLNLLDFGATDNANNSRNLFIHYCPIGKEVFTASEELIISYGKRDVVKKFNYFNITFTSVLYLPTLGNNFYSISCLFCQR